MMMKTFSMLIGAISFVTLVYVYAWPPESMRHSREGVPFFTPPVLHPETGEALNVNDLVSHFKGG